MNKGGLPMVNKDGTMVPFYAADGKGKMNKGGMTKKGVMTYNMGGMVKSQVNNLKKGKKLMAEKKKKDPKFGGKRSLKDMSGNKSIGFEDTYLGDLLGFDGKMGTKGKPGLLASLKGARRKKPGTATTTKKKGPAKVRPKLRPKTDAKGPVRRGDGTEAGVKKTKFGAPGFARPAPKPAAPAKPTRQTENKKLFGLEPFKPRGAILRDVATPSAQKKI